MILHLVTFTWKPGTTNDDVAAVVEGLAELPGTIPELRDYRFGPDLGLREGNAHFGVCAQLAEADDVATYLDHPAHQRVVAELIRPILQARQVVQIDLTD